MRTRRRKVQERKPTDVRQCEIVDAAIRILAIDGARSFTTKKIAAEVGITSGAIYRHFKSMGAIIELAVERIGTVLSSDFPEETAEPIDRLKVFFLNRTQTIVSNPHISRLLLSDHLDQVADPGGVKRLRAFKKKSRAFVFRCLREAEQSGNLVGGTSADASAIIVLGAIISLSHARTRVVSGTKIEDLSETVWSTMEHMFVGRNAPAYETKPTRRRQHRRAKGKD